MHFIREYYISDPSICDTVFDALKKLKSNGYGGPGATYTTEKNGDMYNPVLRELTDIKESWDILIPDFAEMYPDGPGELRLDELSKELNEVIIPQYFEDIELLFAGQIFPLKPPHFQLYEPGGGYKVWHTDSQGQNIHRMFVFIMYLNDVPDGGTEFKYQNYTCEAKKGKVVFFPANFCYVHRSQISYTSEKAIMTGWLDTDLISMLRGDLE